MCIRDRAKAGGILVAQGIARYPGGSFAIENTEPIKNWIIEAVAQLEVDNAPQFKRFLSDYGSLELSIACTSRHILLNAFNKIGDEVNLTLDPIGMPVTTTMPVVGADAGSPLSEDKTDLKSLIELLTRAAADDFNQLVAEAQGALALVRKEVIAKLETGINKELASIATKAFGEQKRELNELKDKLKSLGISIRCPKTGQAGNLYAITPTVSQPKGQFWIKPHGSTRPSFSIPELKALLPLKLVDTPQRREGLAILHKKAEASEERGR